MFGYQHYVACAAGMGQANDVRGDEDDEFAVASLSILVRGGLQARDFTETGKAVDGVCFLRGEVASHHRASSILQIEIGGELAIGQDRDVVDGCAAERLNLEIEFEADRLISMDVGRGLQLQTDVLILDLRDGLLVEAGAVEAQRGELAG